MGAKQSAEMTKALALVASGTNVRKAAEKCGVWYTSLYQAMKRHEAKAQQAKKKNKKA
jgi:transposase